MTPLEKITGMGAIKAAADNALKAVLERPTDFHRIAAFERAAETQQKAVYQAELRSRITKEWGPK